MRQEERINCWLFRTKAWPPSPSAFGKVVLVEVRSLCSSSCRFPATDVARAEKRATRAPQRLTPMMPTSHFGMPPSRREYMTGTTPNGSSLRATFRSSVQPAYATGLSVMSRFFASSMILSHSAPVKSLSMTYTSGDWCTRRSPGKSKSMGMC